MPVEELDVPEKTWKKVIARRLPERFVAVLEELVAGAEAGGPPPEPPFATLPVPAVSVALLSSGLPT